ncbi:MAG: 3'-5' exonuclease [Dongiaceae bacterium]
MLFSRLRGKPQRPTPPDDLSVSALHVVALDCETTGLDTRRDRIVSIATVPIVAGRLDVDAGFDRLVNPGCPIPARSTGVHGIRDEHVVAQPAFSAILPELAASLEEAVMLGHEIGFDAAMIRREARLARLRWLPPPMIDTMLLGAALMGESADLRLESMAARLDVEVRGRHTALGDARAAAEIFLRLLPELAARGATCLGDLRAICRGQERVLRHRLGPGW